MIDRDELPPRAKVICVRWVDTHKGSDADPRIRSRLVAQEFNLGSSADGDMFAPTPLLGATRYVLSCLASRGERGPGAYRCMLLYFQHALLCGDVERQIFIHVRWYCVFGILYKINSFQPNYL